MGMLSKARPLGYDELTFISSPHKKPDVLEGLFDEVFAEMREVLLGQPCSPAAPVRERVSAS